MVHFRDEILAKGGGGRTYIYFTFSLFISLQTVYFKAAVLIDTDINIIRAIMLNIQ